MDFSARLKNLLRWARVTQPAKSNGAFHIQQVEYKGKAGNCVMIFPYGMHANVAPDSLVAMFAMEGNADNRAGIGWDSAIRPDLKSGEVAVYHPKSGTLIKLNTSGGIDITATGDINITTTTVVNITAPVVNLEADVNISGSLQVGGDINIDGIAALGGAGGSPIARVGDTVSAGVISTGSATHKAT